jgi:hypothetical protein
MKLLAIVKKTTSGNSKSISSKSFLNLRSHVNNLVMMRLDLKHLDYRLMVVPESVSVKKYMGAL